jgi:hypothetical protein
MHTALLLLAGIYLADAGNLSQTSPPPAAEPKPLPVGELAAPVVDRASIPPIPPWKGPPLHFNPEAELVPVPPATPAKAADGTAVPVPHELASPQTAVVPAPTGDPIPSDPAPKSVTAVVPAPTGDPIYGDPAPKSVTAVAPAPTGDAIPGDHAPKSVRVVVPARTGDLLPGDHARKSVFVQPTGGEYQERPGNACPNQDPIPSDNGYVRKWCAWLRGLFHRSTETAPVIDGEIPDGEVLSISSPAPEPPVAAREDAHP